MEMIEVQSSAIARIGYENKILRIEYHSGGCYDYQDVPEAVYESLMRSKSLGSFVAKYIQGVFKYIKL